MSGVVFVSACTNDFGTSEKSASPPPSSATKESTATNGGAADASTGDGGSSGDAGNTSTGDGGNANDGGAQKPNGQPCTKDVECRSGSCHKQEGNGVKAGKFCTIDCDNDDEPDPLCAPTPPFTGQCGPDGDCIIQ